MVCLGLGFSFICGVVGPGDLRLWAQAFLVAHLGFVSAFVVRGLQLRRCIVSAVLWLPLGGALFAWLWPIVPASERSLIFGYMAVITAMVILAGGTRGEGGDRLILAGAVAFYISDVLLARSRFVEASIFNTAVGYPLYYTACVLLAWSIRGAAVKRREQLSPDGI